MVYYLSPNSGKSSSNYGLDVSMESAKADTLRVVGIPVAFFVVVVGLIYFMKPAMLCDTDDATKEVACNKVKTFAAGLLGAAVGLAVVKYAIHDDAVKSQ